MSHDKDRFIFCFDPDKTKKMGRIFVNGDDYSKLVNGKSIDIVVDSVGNSPIVAKLSFDIHQKGTNQ